VLIASSSELCSSVVGVIVQLAKGSVILVPIFVVGRASGRGSFIGIGSGRGSGLEIGMGVGIGIQTE